LKGFKRKVFMRERKFSLNQLIAIGVVTRLFLDTGVQLFFPYLRVIANGMGISTIDLGRLLSMRSLLGLSAPLFGALAERRSNRAVMRLGLLISGIGYLLIGVSTSLWVAALGMALSAIGSFSFLPSLQAYLSVRLPYNRRAWGLGVVEYAWALSGIFGLFLLGQLIAATNWRIPMFIIGTGMLIAWILYRWLPTGEVDAPPKPTIAWSNKNGFRSLFTLGKGQRSAWLNLIGQSVIMFSGFNLFIGYGVWLDSDYQLGAQGLGVAALIIGVADLGASVLVSIVSDRLGKRRSVLIGIASTLFTLFLLPFFDNILITAVIGLALVRFCFEFTVVSNIPLLTEQIPTQRAKVMGLATAFGLSGSAVAGLTGPWLLANHDIVGVSIVSAISIAFALLLMWQVKDPGEITTVETPE
jgi:predicted MFS family arabinose efflux permease